MIIQHVQGIHQRGAALGLLQVNALPQRFKPFLNGLLGNAALLHLVLAAETVEYRHLQGQAHVAEAEPVLIDETVAVARARPAKLHQPAQPGVGAGEAVGAREQQARIGAGPAVAQVEARQGLLRFQGRKLDAVVVVERCRRLRAPATAQGRLLVEAVLLRGVLLARRGGRLARQGRSARRAAAAFEVGHAQALAQCGGVDHGRTQRVGEQHGLLLGQAHLKFQQPQAQLGEALGLLLLHRQVVALHLQAVHVELFGKAGLENLARLVQHRVEALHVAAQQGEARAGHQGAVVSLAHLLHHVDFGLLGLLLGKLLVHFSGFQTNKVGAIEQQLRHAGAGRARVLQAEGQRRGTRLGRLTVGGAQGHGPAGLGGGNVGRREGGALQRRTAEARKVHQRLLELEVVGHVGARGYLGQASALDFAHPGFGGLLGEAGGEQRRLILNGKAHGLGQAHGHDAAGGRGRGQRGRGRLGLQRGGCRAGQGRQQQQLK